LTASLHGEGVLATPRVLFWAEVGQYKYIHTRNRALLQAKKELFNDIRSALAESARLIEECERSTAVAASNRPRDRRSFSQAVFARRGDAGKTAAAEAVVAERRGDGDAGPPRNDAFRDAAHALRAMTANLMRLAGGGGKSSEVVREILAVIAALKHYFAETGEALEDSGIESALCVVGDFFQRVGPADAASARRSAEDDVIRGALLIAAARLLEQPSPEALGRDELRSAVSLLARAFPPDASP
jgi:hypothetical protein